jgi:hypothetical protein
METASRFELFPLFLDGEQRGEAVDDGTRRRKATNERLTRQRLEWMLEIPCMFCEWSTSAGSAPKRATGELNGGS